MLTTLEGYKKFMQSSSVHDFNRRIQFPEEKEKNTAQFFFEDFTTCTFIGPLAYVWFLASIVFFPKLYIYVIRFTIFPDFCHIG